MIHVRSAATGSGTQFDPWVGWDGITWLANGHYHFESGYYAYENSPNFLHSGIQIIGEAGVFLKHTGRGDAFVMDAVTSGHWVQNTKVENINLLGSVLSPTDDSGCTSTIGTDQVLGYGTHFTRDAIVGDAISVEHGGQSQNETAIITAIADDTHMTVDRPWMGTHNGPYWIGKTRHGFNITRARQLQLINCTVRNVFGDGLHSEQCVTCMAEQFQLSLHVPEQAGYFLINSARAIAIINESTTWSINNPVVEGVQDVGIYIDPTCFANTIINGTSESNFPNAVGILIEGDVNTLIGIDVEANPSTKSIIVTGQRNILQNVGADYLTKLDGPRNQIIGGKIKDLELTLNAQFTSLQSPLIMGTLTDNSGGWRSGWLIEDSTHIQAFTP